MHRALRTGPINRNKTTCAFAKMPPDRRRSFQVEMLALSLKDGECDSRCAADELFDVEHSFHSGMIRTHVGNIALLAEIERPRFTRCDQL